MQLLQTMPAGGAGAATFLGLTDTPAAYTGEAAKYARVAAGEAALEFHDLLNVVNTWSALQTFGAGIKLAASQQIKDSGGTGRVLLATALPNITLTGSTRINSNVGIDSAPSISPDYKLYIHPTPTGVTDWAGIGIIPVLTFSGDGCSGYGIFGTANAYIPAASSGHSMFGLAFSTTAIAAGAAGAMTQLIGCNARPALMAIGSGKALTITTYTSFEADPFMTTSVFAGGAATITTARGLHVKGASKNVAALSIPTAYGAHIEDFVGSSFGTVRLLEVGPATPYLRVVGKADPSANESNLYLKLGATLKQVTEYDADSAGVGYRALRVPN